MATIIAIDVSKSVFEVAVSDRPGRVREHHRLSRPQFSAIPRRTTEEAKIVQRIYGAFTEGHSIQAIAARLNSEGVSSRKNTRRGDLPPVVIPVIPAVWGRTVGSWLVLRSCSSSQILPV